MQVPRLFLCLYIIAVVATAGVPFLLLISRSLTFSASIQVTLTHPDAWIEQSPLYHGTSNLDSRAYDSKSGVVGYKVNRLGQYQSIKSDSIPKSVKVSVNDSSSITSNDTKKGYYNQRTISDLLRNKDRKWFHFSVPTPRTARPLPNTTGGGVLATRFRIRQDFSFPEPQAVRSITEVMRMPWFRMLRRYLSTIPPNSQITLATSNSRYLDVLLNWLISATVRSGIPITSILIISLDRNVHELLHKKGITSVYILPEALVNPNAAFREPFEKVMMTRLAVMRILNHWGFDVANYDTDAIILKDPQPLYDDLRGYDIVGSVGKHPDDLTEMWGITICIGVVLMRSSERTEAWWNSMEDICQSSFDDQENLNCGLLALDIHWSNNDTNYQNTTVYGRTENGMTVAILPYDNICRQLTCDPEQRSRLYIWHKGGSRKQKDKLAQARYGRTWFLRSEWDTMWSNSTGVEWLSSIAYYRITHS